MNLSKLIQYIFFSLIASKFCSIINVDNHYFLCLLSKPPNNTYHKNKYINI